MPEAKLIKLLLIISVVVVASGSATVAFGFTRSDNVQHGSNGLSVQRQSDITSPLIETSLATQSTPEVPPETEQESQSRQGSLPPQLVPLAEIAESRPFDRENGTYLEPMVLHRLSELVGTARIVYARGIAQPEVTIDVTVDLKRPQDGAKIESMEEFLLENGATRIGFTFGYRVPILLFPRLLEHPRFGGAFLIYEHNDPYPKLDRPLHNVVSILNNGGTDTEAAEHTMLNYKGKVGVFVDTPTTEAYHRVTAFLTANDVYVNPEIAEENPGQLSVLLPPSLLVPLSKHADVTKLETLPLTGVCME